MATGGDSSMRAGEVPARLSTKRRMTNDEWAKFSSNVFFVGVILGIGVGWLLGWWLA